MFVYKSVDCLFTHKHIYYIRLLGKMGPLLRKSNVFAFWFYNIFEWLL